MSTDYDPDKYVATIDAILSVADMQEITVKRIRNALQELFGVDLQPHKKDINELITNRYFLLLDKKEEETEEEKEKSAQVKREEMERQDALLAAKLSQAEYYGVGRRLRQVTDFKNGKRKPKRKSSETTEKTKRPAGSGFNKEMVLSRELESVLGISKCSRPQVVKQLWGYIKDNNLQNPEDRRLILCDEKLENLFKKKMVSSFEMNKLLTKHIFKPEDIDDNSTVSTTTRSKIVEKESEFEESSEEE